jgi:hypothetical protein
MMHRHGEPELGHRIAAIGQQALAEGGIRPGLGNDARAIVGDPLFLGEVLELVDEFGRLHAALLECRLNGVGPLLDGGDGVMNVGLVWHAGCSQRRDDPI